MIRSPPLPQNQRQAEEIEAVLELHDGARCVVEAGDEHAFLQDFARVGAVGAGDADVLAEREDAGELEVVARGFVGRVDDVVGENGQGATALRVGKAGRGVEGGRKSVERGGLRWNERKRRGEGL